jgi:hypothetical protein
LALRLGGHPLEANVLLVVCKALFWLRLVAASAFYKVDVLIVKNIFVRKKPKQ